MTDTRRPLDVTAELTLTVEGEEVRVVGFGELVVVDAPSLGGAFALLRGAGQLPTEQFGENVRAADVTVDVRVDGVSVARLGPDLRPGYLSRALGVAPARLSLGGVALALLRG
ncbi:peptide ABC transporter ATP-binding protein [Haloprofundus salinisoli]|uniref:peptide ABC transporter ATP-binding protein n=1 Tax=Haloprofundus salinisoli TaxID=2876193 RepID=UPI001CCD8D09|nr:peptide ABC transporter ATP-binding protein [Haloprofundus salinisoli]